VADIFFRSSKGETGPQKERERLERVEKRMKVLSRTHKMTISKWERQNTKIQKHVRKRMSENARLVRQIRDIREAVAVRENIFRYSSSSVPFIFNLQTYSSGRDLRLLALTWRLNVWLQRA